MNDFHLKIQLNLGFVIIPGMQTQLMLSEDFSKAFILNTNAFFIIGRAHRAAFTHHGSALLIKSSCYLSTLAKLSLKFHNAVPPPTTSTPGTLSHKRSGHFVRNGVEP